VQGHFAARDINNKFVEGERLVFDGGLCRFLNLLAHQTRAPYLCFYARHQFAHGEWFGQVVVCAYFKADHAVNLIIAGGEHKDGSAHFLAQDARHFEAIQFREHNIEYNQVRFQAARGFNR
jgi:hypothetical protein